MRCGDGLGAPRIQIEGEHRADLVGLGQVAHDGGTDGSGGAQDGNGHRTGNPITSRAIWSADHAFARRHRDGRKLRPTTPTCPTSTSSDKGLKSNAIGFVSSVVIGVASTAPGYSLAASLGFIAAVVGIGLQSPAILLIAFIPMVLIAPAYYYLNRADPDCGTTFSWVGKAMGPWAGWIGGWAIIVADIIVMANLAQIAGQLHVPALRLDSAANSTAAVTALGVVWIVVMTAICYIGIELSARTQVVLLGAEIVTLALFAVVALVKVAAGTAAATRSTRRSPGSTRSRSGRSAR